MFTIFFFSRFFHIFREIIKEKGGGKEEEKLTAKIIIPREPPLTPKLLKTVMKVGRSNTQIKCESLKKQI